MWQCKSACLFRYYDLPQTCALKYDLDSASISQQSCCSSDVRSGEPRDAVDEKPTRFLRYGNTFARLGRYYGTSWRQSQCYRSSCFRIEIREGKMFPLIKRLVNDNYSSWSLTTGKCPLPTASKYFVLKQRACTFWGRDWSLTCVG